MPKIAETISDQRVRSHTFHFVTPSDTDTLKILNACAVCHTDKSTEWATAALKAWPDQSLADGEMTVEDACLLRFRPIMMTTAAAMVFRLRWARVLDRNCISRLDTRWSEDWLSVSY
jgi:hypothetical protein